MDNPVRVQQSDCQQLCSKALFDLTNCVKSLTLNPKVAKNSLEALYEALFSSSMNEICNDTTLTLYHTSCLQQKGWSDSIAWNNEAAT
jgi:hypothetical protein